MPSQEYQYADVDRGANLAATYIAGCLLSLIFVVMRFFGRYSIAGVGIDDWCMLVTWIVFLPLTVLVSIFSLGGGTRHMVYLHQDPTHTHSLLKLNWIAQPLAIFCLGSAKISVAFLITRLLNRTSVWRRWSLYITSALTAINTCLMIIFTFAQCEKPAALWDDELRPSVKCWDPSIQSNFSIYGASMHAAMDFFLALLPITLVWGLKTSLRKRLALCGLLGCGSITGICAAIKTTKLLGLTARSDLTWETYSLFMWTGIEIILSIVLGSIPALKPIYALCMGRNSSSSRSRSTPRYTTHPTGAVPDRKEYARHNGSNLDSTIDPDLNFALNPVTQFSTTVIVGNAAEGEIEARMSEELEKGGGIVGNANRRWRHSLGRY